MKVLITGSTGMVGKAVLLECIDDPIIENIVLLNRRSLGEPFPKTIEVLTPDFTDLSSVKNQLQNIDAVFHCMGASSVGLNEEQYSRVTYDMTLEIANVVKSGADGKSVCFCYISGAGSDSSEKGSSMWARVKGKTENKIIELFDQGYAIRPAAILPKRGVKSSTWWYNILYVLFRPFFGLMKHNKKYVTDSTTLAKAMIKVAHKGAETKVLESIHINNI